MIHVVIINGFPGAGKDTFVDYCRQWAEKTGDCAVYNAHSSDMAKEALGIFGYTNKDRTRPEVRDLLADLIEKTNKIWDSSFSFLNDVILAISETSENNCNVLFFHERKPENIARYKAAFEGMSLLIERKDIAISKITNAADRNVINYDYDKIITNNRNLKELRAAAESFMHNFMN